MGKFNSNSKRISIQILFWIGFWLVNFIDEVENIELIENLTYSLTYSISIILLVYFNVLWVIPTFLYKQKYALYFLILGAFTAMSILISEIPDFDFYFDYFLLDFVHSILLIGGISSVWIVIEQFRMKEELIKAEKEQTSTNLKYLKAQTNPHFLFNVLNNINFLIENNPEKASETLFKLSDMLRYQLYDADAEEVLIEKEIRHLENYIELEKIRIGDRLDLKIEIDYEDNKMKIPPFLFLPLIENAFKYSSSVEGSFINFKLKITSVSVNLIIENSILEKENMKLSGGLGLKNLKQRLELLYPKKHQLQFGKSKDNFKVNLFINL